MRVCVAIIGVCLFFLVLCITEAKRSPILPIKSEGKTGAPLGWDFLFLVQQWGPSFCATQSRDPCSVPSNVNWWTLHGLWPNNNDTSYPSSCNASDPFNESKIVSLLRQMNLYWTNYLTNEPATEFWAHEWDKHGTCATTDPLLNSQLNFFAGALKARQNNDIYQALLNGGVTPSNSYPVSASAVKTAIRKAFGVDPVLGCVYSHDLQEEVLAEVGLCLTANLVPFQCDSRVYQRGIERSCQGNSPYYLASSGL